MPRVFALDPPKGFLVVYERMKRDSVGGANWSLAPYGLRNCLLSIY